VLLLDLRSRFRDARQPFGSTPQPSRYVRRGGREPDGGGWRATHLGLADPPASLLPCSSRFQAGRSRSSSWRSSEAQRLSGTRSGATSVSTKRNYENPSAFCKERFLVSSVSSSPSACPLRSGATKTDALERWMKGMRSGRATSAPNSSLNPPERDP